MFNKNLKYSKNPLIFNCGPIGLGLFLILKDNKWFISVFKARSGFASNSMDHVFNRP